MTSRQIGYPTTSPNGLMDSTSPPLETFERVVCLLEVGSDEMSVAKDIGHGGG